MSLPLLVIFAVAIIVVLLAYTGFLYWRLWRVRKQQHEAALLAAKTKQDNVHYAQESIDVLLRGLEQQQLSLTEAAIRVSALSKVLPDTDQAQYQVFEQLAHQTSHIPILEEWKKLSSLQQVKFDDERIKLEKEHQDTIMKQVAVILGKAPAVQTFDPGKNTLH